ncbi:hypothetical protein ACQ4PT_006510 [Festuca glaucescens]
MTVRETLDFSSRCLGVGARYDMLAELSKRERDAGIKPDPAIDAYMKATAVQGQETNIVTDLTLKVLGLDICADTMIGDDMIRGISGGQKKRVTTGEMLTGPARALFMDEISTGLDSSSTFQIVKYVKQLVHVMNETVMISLLQPPPETYNLFDDIILLSEGYIVYHGPRENILEFFESSGFRCPERKGVADFLQEVTSKKDQQQYWYCEQYHHVSVPEFAERFKSFHVGLQILKEMQIPFEKSKTHPAALTTKKYGISSKESLKAVMSRDMLLMKRNSFIYIFKVSQLIILGLMAMTVFLRTKMPSGQISDGGKFLGALTFSLITILFNGFFRQLLAFFATHQMAMAMFRLMGAVLKSMVAANTFGMFVILIIFIFGGFLIPRGDIKPWWIWAYWSSPMMYSQNAISVNEFLPVDGPLPGVLTALVGVSGAGKTTLMDVLAGRKTSGSIEGSITLSGYPKKQETFARISGYCEQSDVHSPNVTVYESILYSAWLRLSSDVDDKTRKMFVEEVMTLVELDVLRNAMVGLPGVDGLSTEQRKRLTIAVELVSNPSIIFMDEPTSGLDARAAAIVMRATNVEIIYNILQGCLYTIVIYSMIGYEWKADKFLYFLFFIISSFNYFTLFGMMLVAFTPSLLLANILAGFAIPLWNLFSGFLVFRVAIPIWWRWYYWADPVSWTIYGVVASQFGESTGTISVPGGSPVLVKKFLHDNLGMQHDFLGYLVLGHFAYVIAFFVFGYSIKVLNFQKR